MSTPAEEAKPLAKKKKKVPFDYSPYIRVVNCRIYGALDVDMALF